jgi:hypothetical protein
MKFRASIVLLSSALPLALLAADDRPTATPTPTPKPTILKRWMKTFGMAQDQLPNTSATGFKGLDMGVTANPAQVTLPETKQIKVTVMLANEGRKIAQLEFPTSQRIEVLVKSKEGKTIEQWSEDQAFNNEPTVVTINPHERLEYVANIPTRDMVVGQTYTIEAFFPNFEQLRKSVAVPATNTAPAATPDPKTGVVPTATPSGKRKKL